MSTKNIATQMGSGAADDCASLGARQSALVEVLSRRPIPKSNRYGGLGRASCFRGSARCQHLPKGPARQRKPKLELYLQEYIDATAIKGDPNGALFRSADWHTGSLKAIPLHRVNAWKMVQRRAKAAGIVTRICNHTFRATGITVYLSNGGSVEKAQQMANHSDPRTTKLYDRAGMTRSRSMRWKGYWFKCA